MKRLKNCWQQIVGFDNLLLAFHKACRGKRQRDSVAWFSFNLEAELCQLQQELVEGSYRPGAYRQFVIYERKPRLISAAPFRDRVLHHALMNVLEPWLDKRFISASYACRHGKGVHRAVNRYQQWAQRYAYVMKLDIRRYFPSINHEILKSQLRTHIADTATLNILDLVIDSAPGKAPATGIPIGNLTSQTFANLYLNGLDQFVKQTLGCKPYLRYVDDLILLADAKSTLWWYRAEIENYLQDLKLHLHQHKVQVCPSTQKIDLLGYQVSRQRRWLRNDNGYAARRRLNKMALAYANYQLDLDTARAAIMSWLGHAQHGETKALVSVLFANCAFQRKKLNSLG